MRISLSLIKIFANINPEITIENIAHTLTMNGFEVEEIIDRSKDLSPFIIAEIIEAEKHPSADKLRCCKVNNGTEILEIVCGAANARKGIKVVLAPVGSFIPGSSITIKASEIRGMKSNGMLCAADELLLEQESEGIIELPIDAPIGESFCNYFGYNDPVLDISITPNRGDAVSAIGIAREIIAAGLATKKDHSFKKIDTKTSSNLSISTQTKNCPYFSARIINNIKNVTSPMWLKAALEKLGQKSISAVVDVTNYLQILYGQPLHAYDLSKISGNVVVDEAQEGEVFMALNDKEYKLPAGTITIRDSKEILCLGGIIGGKSSGADLSTTSIMLESAIFMPEAIAISGRKLGIITDSRYRFERGTDHQQVTNVLNEAAAMIIDICGGEASNVIEAGTNTYTQKTLDLNIENLNSILGTKFEANYVLNTLTKLNFQNEQLDQGIFKITVPSYRNDITSEECLIEEFARIHGLENIADQPLSFANHPDFPIIDLSTKRNLISKRIAASLGYDEVINYSFIDENSYNMFNMNSSTIKLLNPISSEESVMRTNLLPGLLKNIATNARRQINSVSLIESGQVFFGLKENEQKQVIAGVRAGKAVENNIYDKDRYFDFYDVKTDCFALLTEFGFNPEKMTISDETPAYYHPGKSAKLAMGNNVIAYFGELHPKIYKIFDIKGPVCAFEILEYNLPETKSKKGKKAKYQASDFQAVTRDFAFIIDEKIRFEAILKQTKNVDNNLIQDIKLFDIYQGSNINEGKKSVAVRVIIQAMDRTLSDEEIQKISDKIITSVSLLGGELRA